MVQDHLLVVEDEDLLRELIASPLIRAGYAVDSATSAEQGLEQLHTHRYELLLIDLNLPGMDGFHFLQEAHIQGHLGGALVVTGYGSLENALQAIRLEADGFLTKPFYPGQLVEAVEEILERRRRAAEAHLRHYHRPFLELVRHALTADDALTLVDSLLDQVSRCTSAERAALFLRTGDHMGLAGHRGFHRQLFSPPEATVARLESWLAEKGEGLMAEGSFLTWPGLRPVSPGTASIACLPLLVYHRLDGLLVLSCRQPRQALHQSDIEFGWVACSLVAPSLGAMRQ